MNSVGKILYNARISKNISINKVASQLNLTLDIINKFENDQIENNTDIIFYIGHLRSYCNYLDLDSDEITKIFKSQISFNDNYISEQIQKPKFQYNLFLFSKIIPFSLFIFVFIGFYLLFIRESNNVVNYALIPDLPENYIPIIEQETLNIPLKTIPNNEKIINEQIEDFNTISAIASDKIVESNTSHTVTLKLLNPTWIQLRDKSDKIILSQLMDKDSEYSYNIELDYNITAGNAGNILVIIDSEVRGKIGKYGEIVDSLILDYKFNN